MIHQLFTPEGKETGLVAVCVPGDARLFLLNIAETIHKKDQITYEYGFFQIGMMPVDVDLRDYTILGLCTKDEVGFDAAPHVRCISANLDLWENYKTDSQYFEYLAKSTSESLRSLLSANGLYWELPEKYKDGEPSKLNHDVWYSKQEYHAAQSKLLGNQNLLILRQL